MDIFGRHIFGKDAQQFIDLCFEDQVAYIEKYTTQRDKEQIKLLLSNLALDKDGCLFCAGWLCDGYVPNAPDR